MTRASKNTAKKSKLAVLRPPMLWDSPVVRPAEGDCVVLLHGLWRSCWALEPMAKFLHQEAGFHVLNIPYPSFRWDIRRIAEHISEVIQRECQCKTVHFVTHSMGGMVVRELARIQPITGRVVNLAPPHNGSTIMTEMERYKLTDYVFGPAKQVLANTPSRYPIPELDSSVEQAAIMGDVALIPIFQKLMDGDNDGIVSTSEGKLPQLKEYHLVPCDHTYIVCDEKVMQMTANFLKLGHCLTPPA
ncbi:alpha/beta hydrolase [Persicirhabdus sediminis]|nr:alpha/beta hydrolase [Persicirhabdus sediminis]